MISVLVERDSSILSLSVDHRVFIFQRVALAFSDYGLTNVFARKNNRTLAETLSHQRYQALRQTIIERYSTSLNEPLGGFLLKLKEAGDPIYKRFLNPYGDGIYCKFAMQPGPLAKEKGIYCYCAVDKLVYLGRSRDPFGKRINQGYGTIHPKNCYLDGQATNCHMNALIAAETQEVSCYVCRLSENHEIEDIECCLIKRLQPAWNIALK